MRSPQLPLNGGALGAAYALAALGFGLLLNATRAVKFAQGDMVMAGGFLAVALGQVLPLPGIALLPAVVALLAALRLLASLVAYIPHKDRPPTSLFHTTPPAAATFQQANGPAVAPGQSVSERLGPGGASHTKKT